jgi:hypothetical protein
MGSRLGICGSRLVALSHGTLALVIGLAPTVATVTLVHDVLPSHPPEILSWAVLAGTLALATVILGHPLASQLRATIGLRRIAAIGAGVAAGVAHAASGPSRLLRSPIGPVEQLAWILGEEDNAQIVGVAREMITAGPGGAELSAQYGTGFMVLPTLVQRITGPRGDATDARLLAVEAFTLSVVLAILILGLAMFLLSISIARTTNVPTILGLVVTAMAALGATTAAFAVAVFMPMRTGFLTLVWSIAWVALMVALAAAGTHRLSVTPRAFIAAQLLVLTLLVLRSWPFLIAAALPPLLLALRDAPLDRMRSSLRRRWYVVLALVTVGVIATVPYIRESAVGEVLSYGREALTVGGSGIFADRAAIFATACGVLLAVVMLGWTDRGERWFGVPAGSRVLLVLGVPGAAWLSWVGLKVAAAALTSGELNYAGWKLFYAAVAIAAVTGLPALVGTTSVASPAPRLLGPVLIGGLLLTSSTAQTASDWWERTAPRTPPHAIAAIDAVRASSVDLPIRCTPQPGAAATDGARWAAYYCVRWMEDAFNEERFHGHRFTFLDTTDPTFEDAVRIAREQDASRYTFAYPMTVGPGWFGWDGVS